MIDAAVTIFVTLAHKNLSDGIAFLPPMLPCATLISIDALFMAMLKLQLYVALAFSTTFCKLLLIFST
jgi:hypothetical protein